MTLRDKIATQSPGARTLGTIAAVCTGFSAIALACLISFKTFWWCPQGGCSLASWTAKFRLLSNVSGLIVLMAFFALLLQFPFVLLARPCCDRSTVEEAFLAHPVRMLGWHDALMRKWVALLWR